VKFTYNNYDPAIVSLIIAKATKQETVAYARKHLFALLGIGELSWGEDKPFSGGAADLCLKPRDMAKIGYLYLNEGSWDGKQVISAAWVRDSTSKQVDMPDPTHPEVYGYGNYWGLYRARNHSAFYAIGMGGQIIYALPELDIVYVSTSTSRMIVVPPQLRFPAEDIVPSILSK